MPEYLPCCLASYVYHKLQYSCNLDSPFQPGLFHSLIHSNDSKIQIEKKKKKCGNQSLGNNVETTLSHNILLKTGEGKHRGSQIYAI